MINFGLLSKDELKELFNEFNTQYLQQPFKNPSKDLRKFIPNGFRPNSLSKTQIVKVYVDALYAGEISLCRYVSMEIEKNFERSGILDYFTKIGISGKLTYDQITVVIGNLSAMIWNNEMSISGYLALKLYGVNCTEEQKKMSKALQSAYCTNIEHMKEVGEKKGKEKGEEIAETATKNAEKYITQLILELDSCKQKSAKLLKEKEKVKSECEELKTQINGEQKRIQQEHEKVEQYEKKIITLENDLLHEREDSKQKDDIKKQLEKKLQDANKYQEERDALQRALIDAQAMAYSEKVLRIICLDVLDELRSSSLSSKQILEIAKKRFSEADTILEGWKRISAESEINIEKIIIAFAEREFSLEYIDIIEDMEDGILIKYSVLKALKAVLYDAMTKNESKKGISERFSDNG